VSDLSAFVAKKRPIPAPVSPALSKIPYGGFSPVRLQASCQRRPSLAKPTWTLPQWLSPARAFDSVRGLASKRHTRILTPHTRPVALGSATGYIVRQPHRLLWPHPRLWNSATAYALPPQRSLSSRASPIYSACPLVRAVVHTPVVSAISYDYSSITDAAFILCRGIQQPLGPASPARLGVSRGCNIRFLLRPGPWLALPGQDFYFRACAADVATRQRRISLRGQQSIPATGLSPAGQTALWAAPTKKHIPPSRPNGL
jgi:hypothetical protein